MKYNHLIINALIAFSILLFSLSANAAGSVGWRRAVDALTIFRSSFQRHEMASPVVASDRVYVASSRGKMAVYDKETGRKLGVFKLEAGAVSTPAVDDGRIYLGMKDGFFRCLDAGTGAEAWKYEVKGIGISEPAIAGNLVVFQTGRDIVVALDKQSGEWAWSYHHERREDLAILGLSQPLVRDGTVYMGLSGGYIAALDLSDGREIWKTMPFSSGGYSDVDARLNLDESAVYATSYAGETASVSRRTGMVYWRHPAGGMARPCVGEEYIYIATMDEKVVALDKMVGTKAWERELEGPPEFDLNDLWNIFPAMVADKRPETPMAKRVKDRNWLLASELVGKNLIVHDRMGNFYYINPDNGFLKRRAKQAKAVSSPMAVEGDKGYLLSDKGYLYRIWLK